MEGQQISGDDTGHILRKNCLLKHVTQGKKKAGREDDEEEVSSTG